MKKKIGLLVVHGVGPHRPDYSQVFIQKLYSRLNKELMRYPVTASECLVTKSILWSDILVQREELEKRLFADSVGLKLSTLRRILLRYAGDAVAYRIGAFDEDVYSKVHERIAKGLRELADTIGHEAPLCIVAHSLGSVMILDYMQSLQQAFYHTPTELNHESIALTEQKHESIALAERSSVERGETLFGLVTMGSPYAVWALANRDLVSPIMFPHPWLSTYVPNVHARWINFYASADILSFPLRTINRDWEANVTQDIEVPFVLPWKRWTPYSHICYFSSRFVIRTVAQTIKSCWMEL